MENCENVEEESSEAQNKRMFEKFGRETFLVESNNESLLILD